MKNYISREFHGPLNLHGFLNGLQLAINQIPQAGVFVGDNLFTYGKSLGFLNDDSFMQIFEKNIQNDDRFEYELSQSIIWRAHVLSWAAKASLKLEGDFVECACYRGVSAKIICDYLDFNSTGKHYYLYDLFEYEEGMDHHALADHGSALYEQVKQKFNEYVKVRVIKGEVPQILHSEAPAAIAFMHLDINSAAAEMGALEILFDRIVPGGILILDDYGWIYYRDQKQAEDKFFAERGYRVLELPTGQGMLIK